LKNKALIFPLEFKIIFISFNGELSYQFKVNKMLITENEITPAAFSRSVFNAAPALATIALGLKAGYTAVYPASFKAGFMCAASPLLCGDAEECVLAYADEAVPDEYLPLCNKAVLPLSFATLLSLKPQGDAISIFPAEDNSALDSILETPASFLKAII
jgi:hypothetical protein